MLKYFLAAAALVVAGVPAAIGLTSNASFSRDVPVRVPSQAQTVSPSTDDDGTADQGPGVEPGDDNGGLVPRDERTEAGDDRDAGEDDGHHARQGDDDGTADQGPGDGGTSGDDRSGSNSGSDDSGSGGGDDRSGSNSGSGDSGSGGSGGSDDGSGHD